MTTIETLILTLILCCPRHELNRDAELRSEVAGYFETAGKQYDMPPGLLVIWFEGEASLRIDRVGKLGEIGLPQVHGVVRRTCEEAGYDPKTWRGGIYCGAMAMAESVTFCGSLERGLNRYASGKCKGTPRSRKLVKRRLRAWRKVTR